MLNSGLHDLAPHLDDRGHFGEKRKPVQYYKRRLRALFVAISLAGLSSRVVWRLTTFPHALSSMARQGSPKFNYYWYTRCDLQQLRIDLIETLNNFARQLAKEHGIAVLDLSPLSLAAGASRDGDELVKDFVHPSSKAAREWVHNLAHYIRTQPRRPRGE